MVSTRTAATTTSTCGRPKEGVSERVQQRRAPRDEERRRERSGGDPERGAGEAERELLDQQHAHELARRQPGRLQEPELRAPARARGRRSASPARGRPRAAAGSRRSSARPATSCAVASASLRSSCHTDVWTPSPCSTAAANDAARAGSRRRTPTVCAHAARSGARRASVDSPHEREAGLRLRVRLALRNDADPRDAQAMPAEGDRVAGAQAQRAGEAAFEQNLAGVGPAAGVEQRPPDRGRRRATRRRAGRRKSSRRARNDANAIGWSPLRGDDARHPSDRAERRAAAERDGGHVRRVRRGERAVPWPAGDAADGERERERGRRDRDDGDSERDLQPARADAGERELEVDPRHPPTPVSSRLGSRAAPAGRSASALSSTTRPSRIETRGRRARRPARRG